MATTRTPRKPSRGKTTTRRPPTTTRGGQTHGSGSVTKHAMHDNATHLGPWLVLAFVGILGLVLNALAPGGWNLVGIVALILAATGGLVWSAWATSAHRSRVARWHSAITCSLIGAWLSMCTVHGMAHIEWGQRPNGIYFVDGLNFSPWTILLYLIGGAGLAAAWNHRIKVHENDLKAAELAASREPEPTPWSEAGFDQVRVVKEVKVNAFRTEGVLAIGGTTLDQMQNAARRIEVEQGWPRESLTLTEARRAGASITSRRVHYAVMHEDPLASPVPWPGLNIRRGQTLLDSIDRGLRGDGEHSMLYVAKRGEGAKLKLVVGTNGSGKTAGQVPTILTTAKLGACNILIDPMKALQSYGDIAGAFHMFITNPGLAEAFLERICTHVVQARSKVLAAEGLKSWTPKSRLRMVRIVLEEVSFLSSIGLVEECSKVVRSVGIDLDVSLQRATFDQLPTTLREQLSTILHYGINTPADAKLVLPEDVIDAGARPARWRNDSPGMHYVIQGGIPLDKQVIGVRSWDDPADPRHNNTASPHGFAAVASDVHQSLAPFCEVTAMALGEIWDQRIDPMDLVRRDLTPGPVTTAGLATLHDSPPPPPQPPATEAGDTDMPTVTDSDAVEGVAIEYSPDGSSLLLPGGNGVLPTVIDLGENPDPSIRPNPWGPMPPLPKDLAIKRIGQPSDPQAVPREVYEAAMNTRLEELIDTTDLVNAKDFVEIHQRCRWSRPSIYDFLERWSTPPNDKDPSPQRLRKLHTGKGYLPIRPGQEPVGS